MRLFIVAALFVGCSSSATEELADEATDEARDEVPAASSLTNDAEATLQFDVGTIEQVVDDADGTWLRFDRYQEYGSGKAGPELEREPRYEGSSDVGYVNENPKLRSYPVSDTVEVLLIDRVLLERICAGDDVAENIFLDSTLDELIAEEIQLVSLTFDEAGEVNRIRDQKSC